MTVSRVYKVAGAGFEMPELLGDDCLCAVLVLPWEDMRCSDVCSSGVCCFLRRSRVLKNGGLSEQRCCVYPWIKVSAPGAMGLKPVVACGC